MERLIRSKSVDVLRSFEDTSSNNLAGSISGIAVSIQSTQTDQDQTAAKSA